MSPLLRRLLRRLRLKVAAVGESESISTELAEPVSAHPSPAGRPTSLGGPGVEGPAGSPLVGVSALRYPSGLAGPPDSSAYSGGQMSLSLATDITASAQLDPSLYSTSSRQPPAATVAAAGKPYTCHVPARCLLFTESQVRRCRGAEDSARKHLPCTVVGYDSGFL